MKDNIFSRTYKKASNFFTKNVGSYFSEFQVFGSFGKMLSFSRKSDEKLIEESYDSNVDVFSVVNLVMKTVLTLPILLQVKLKDGSLMDINETSNDSFYDLINKPNDNQTQKEYRHTQLINYLITGNLFQYKMTAVGFPEPSSLTVFPSQFVKVERLEDQHFSENKLVFEYCRYGKTSMIPSEDMIFTKLIDPSCNSERGLSFYQPAYTVLSTSNQVHSAEDSLIKNRGASGLISSNTDDYPLDDEEAKELQDKFTSETGGSENYNKTKVVGKNVKYQKMGLSPKELQLTDIDINKLRKFCNIYGLSSQLLNDTANSTFNNISEAKKSLYTEAAVPFAELMLDGWREDLIPIFNKLNNKNYILSLDTTKIEVLQKDKKAEAEKNKILIETVSNLSEKVYTNRISYESAIQTLVFSFKITQKEAELLIPDSKTQVNGEE